MEIKVFFDPTYGKVQVEIQLTWPFLRSSKASYVRHLLTSILTHCNKNPIYVFPEKELRGLSPISTFVLYFPTFVLIKENMWTDPWNI
jgi:hypothetical protein